MVRFLLVGCFLLPHSPVNGALFPKELHGLGPSVACPPSHLPPPPPPPHEVIAKQIPAHDGEIRKPDKKPGKLVSCRVVGRAVSPGTSNSASCFKAELQHPTPDLTWKGLSARSSTRCRVLPQ